MLLRRHQGRRVRRRQFGSGATGDQQGRAVGHVERGRIGRCQVVGVCQQAGTSRFPLAHCLFEELTARFRRINPTR